MTRVLDRPASAGLEDIANAIADGAAARNREQHPAFPEDAIAALEQDGWLAIGAAGGADRPPATEELHLVREISRADAGVGRIVDGHLNAIERLAVGAEPALRDAELGRVRAGRLRAGVWGADPRGDEGPPAALVPTGGGLVLRGVKTFCSGAGGLDRALVLGRPAEQPGAPLCAWVSLRDERVEIDDRWYAGAGMRSSVSHRVVFHDLPVIAVLGGAGWLTESPWISRDALRTTATWAGILDAAAEAALAALRARPSRTALDELAAGRIRAEHATVGLWQTRAAEVMDRGDHRELQEVAVHARAATAAAAGRLLDEAARACGSHPFATGSALDRARRDIDLFLLQHRLDPIVARDGAAALESRP
ncbi:MAG: acyl-CoA/acyl-ACP dehydrogenase [Solirubrobacteraceae bacterium]|nr:acyl-CoA/acyl-ACP dehydrogenase [Solirubrobacteraceae bacterium]